MEKKRKFLLILMLLSMLLPGCSYELLYPIREAAAPGLPGAVGISLEEIPAYRGEAYVAVNGNVPFFEDFELVEEAFETYSPLDALGRCGVAYANICQEIMPTEERGDIGSVKPTGWQLVKYDVVDGSYLYNRCHLIGYQLAGENANELNLITGTRYLNIQGMVSFEDQVADYVKETDNHVLYRVSPLFDGDDLVAAGVLMEAKSVEDDGDGISFNVFCYNVQPGVTIDYASGDSRLAEDGIPAAAVTYVLNTSRKKFHVPGCASVKEIAEDNRQDVAWSRKKCISNGYEPCKNCKP